MNPITFVCLAAAIIVMASAKPYGSLLGKPAQPKSSLLAENIPRFPDFTHFKLPPEFEVPRYHQDPLSKLQADILGAYPSENKLLSNPLSPFKIWKPKKIRIPTVEEIRATLPPLSHNLNTQDDEVADIPKNLSLQN